MSGTQPTSGVATGPYRWADFVALPDDDRRELIDGHFIETDMPIWLHEFVVAQLTFALVGWSDRGRRGSVVTSGYKVRVNDRRGVMPDVQFFRPGNRPDPRSTALSEGRPDLAVEVISPSSARFDRVAKLGYYAQLGVPEYWIVDADAGSIDRLVLDDGVYIQDEVAPQKTFEPPSFPGLAIDLDLLFHPPRDP